VAEELTDTAAWRGARFTRVDLSGVRMRDVDLTGARIVDALLVDAQLSGLINGLTVNDVEVAPLVAAELDRRHPERLLLRTEDPAGLRAGWAAVEAFWRPTLAAAEDLPESLRQERVEEEWSLVETLRHLIFVTDAWFGRSVLGRDHPYHPFGLVPAFLRDGSALGLDPSAAPSFASVLDVREGRIAEVRAYLSAVDADELARPRRGDDDRGYPPPSTHTVLDCLHVVMDEEWNHHRYAARDLAILTA
jgi:DinB superfamily/Pentapeptide repeats (8 copies)